MNLKIKLDDGAITPSRAHPTDAGLDLYARESAWVYSGSHHTFDTGVHVAIPVGYVGLMASKSGLMSRGLTSRGVIDSDYRGTLKVILFNDGESAYLVKAGDKISQLIITSCVLPELELVTELDETERGICGFGSTGR